MYPTSSFWFLYIRTWTCLTLTKTTGAASAGPSYKSNGSISALIRYIQICYMVMVYACHAIRIYGCWHLVGSNKNGLQLTNGYCAFLQHPTVTDSKAETDCSSVQVLYLAWRYPCRMIGVGSGASQMYCQQPIIRSAYMVRYMGDSSNNSNRQTGQDICDAYDTLSAYNFRRPRLKGGLV